MAGGRPVLEPQPAVGSPAVGAQRGPGTAARRGCCIPTAQREPGDALAAQSRLSSIGLSDTLAACSRPDRTAFTNS